MTARRALGVSAAALALVIATLLLTVGLLFYRPLPTIDGHYRMLGLHERGEVVRDVFGIPRIYARDLHDLFFLQGYVTAQDRYDQMETKRGIGRPELLGTDLDRAAASAPAHVREALDAYAAGVNKFVDQHRQARAVPGGLVLEGRRLERWTARDSISTLVGHLARVRPSSRCLAIPGEATSRGRPMLGADVHVDVLGPRENEPSPGFYEVGLDGGGVRAVGVSLPGVPGLVAGHNGWVAWTLSATSGSHDALATLEAMRQVLQGRRVADAGAPLSCAIDVYGGYRGEAVAATDRLDLGSVGSALGRPRWPVGARLLVDLADVDMSRSAVSHGASAHRASPHYGDQAPLWEIGRTHRLPFTRGAIGRTDGGLVLRAR